MDAVRYFSGDRQLKAVSSMDNAKFAAQFPGVKGLRSDGFTKLVGYPMDVELAWPRNEAQALPVERLITYKANPSKHDCNAKCLNGKHNGTCECACGGKNHGAGMFTRLLEAA